MNFHNNGLLRPSRSPWRAQEVLHTSRLWWLGFGLFLKVNAVEQSIIVRKGARSITVYFGDIAGAHTERRFFRGHTLVINTKHGKPVYIRTTRRQAIKAIHFINAQASDYKAHL